MSEVTKAIDEKKKKKQRKTKQKNKKSLQNYSEFVRTTWFWLYDYMVRSSLIFKSNLELLLSTV